MNRAIKWMVDNHVTANLLMLLAAFGGLLSLTSLKQEIFPEIPLDIITISVVYPGATPEDVEDAIVSRIEDAIDGIDGIEKTSSISSEGMALVTVEVQLGENVQVVKDRIKNEIDRITSFPREAEQPIVSELIRRNRVIDVALFGNVSEKVLKESAEKVRRQLLLLPNISKVEISGLRNYEIAIEISERKLREYGLSFESISRAVQMGNMDMPGGKIRTKNGDILLRTKSLGKRKEEIENIIVSSDFNGRTLYLKDIATVKDDFEDVSLHTYFDGKPAALLSVYRVGDQQPIAVAKTVKHYIATHKNTLPAGLRIVSWSDRSRVLKDRLSLLIRNAIQGFILVLITLALFLEIRMASWVASGIFISFAGSFAAMYFLGVSISMVSLFAFILVLGIVVDDAIVIGESIHSFRERGEPRIAAAKKGAIAVAVPVVFAVLTTVAAFAPLMFVDGAMGKVLAVIPTIIIIVILVSLLESLFILPAHLSSIKRLPGEKQCGIFCRINRFVDRTLRRFINGPYTRFLQRALAHRYMTLAIGIAVLVLSIGLVTGGILKFTFFSDVEGPTIVARLKMPNGTSAEKTRAVLTTLEQSANRVKKRLMKEAGKKTKRDKNGQPIVFKHLYTVVGVQPSLARGSHGRAQKIADPTKAEISIELPPSNERNFGTAYATALWKKETGTLAGIKSIEFVDTLFSAGSDVQIELSDENNKRLQKAVELLKQELSTYSGVSEIRDNFEQGNFELKLKLKPQAATLGLTLADLAGQVRQGFYGAEAMRIQRGRDEVKVMIRYSEQERETTATVDQMRIRGRNGVSVPLKDVAEITYGRGYATISHANGARTITVFANIDETVANANEINQSIRTKLKKWQSTRFPELKIGFEGAQKEQKKTMSSVGKGFLVALFLIYMLLAIPFKSYSQPFIVMTAIPFGIVGAFLGHLILGYHLTVFSFFGIVALSGVVVNDSLVLIDAINKRHRNEGLTMNEAIIKAGHGRFRPILLTSLTTFFGLVPILAETSIQAQFLIPMAISLAFGVIFSTLITLIIIPAEVLILEDVRHLFGNRRSADA